MVIRPVASPTMPSMRRGRLMAAEVLSVAANHRFQHRHRWLAQLAQLLAGSTS
jgi:hypothetical protein